ncbi:MAG: Synerg-CTERM sorting domain-containing protein [Synergistaceae bacterium]|nr:Synerg-CTERM sorting domain-containing protein [Synergistaceae bacterium]
MQRKLALALVVVFLLMAAPLYADSTWKLAGTWNYNLNIAGTIDGSDASLKEAGQIILRMTESGGVEYFSDYDITSKGNLTIGSAYSYGYSYDNKNLTINPIAYVPGASFSTEYDTRIDGNLVHFRLTIRQTAENSISGTATVTHNGTSYTGPISATRPTGGDGGSGGGCNAGYAGLMLMGILPLFFYRRKQ